MYLHTLFVKPRIFSWTMWCETCLAVGKRRGEELAKGARRKEAVERRNGHV